MSGAAFAVRQGVSALRRPLHVSWLLACSAMALIGGIALSTLSIYPELANIQILLAGVALFSITLAKRQTSAGLVVVAIMAGLLVGSWRGENRRLETAGYQAFIGRAVKARGSVADDITRKGGVAGFKLRGVQIGGIRLGGQLWASSSTGLHLRRYDELELSGTLRPGFGGYAASMSFAKVTDARRTANNDPSRAIRDAFDAGLERTIPQPEASLAMGYLTGQHNLLPPSLAKQMQVTGLIHLVIAGGYNVTVLVRLVRRVCVRVAKRLAVVMSGGMLLFLMLAAGFVAPMARTAIVAGLCLVAWYYGRWPHPLVLLPIAAAITALIDPSFVCGDVGWYMTFIAYGGLIILGPMLKRWWWGDNHGSEIKQIIVDTIAVQIVTMPLMAFAFQQYSVYGLLANLLVLPLMSLTMLAIAVAGLGGMALPAAPAHWISWPASLSLSYTHKVAAWLSGAPGAGFGGGLNESGLVLSYALVLFFIWRLKCRTGYDFRSENPIE